VHVAQEERGIRTIKETLRAMIQANLIYLGLVDLEFLNERNHNATYFPFSDFSENRQTVGQRLYTYFE